jgi:hypothetical protein
MNPRICLGIVLVVGFLAATPNAGATDHRRSRLVSSSDAPLDDLRDLRRWNDLPESRRRQLGRAHDRLGRMPPERQMRLLDHLDRLERMPPAERDRVMQNWQRWRALPSDEREKLRQRWRDMDREGASDRRRSADR